MIHPIQFLWKQLNGPQITAITQAVFHYVHGMFDDLCEYFKNFSIDSASAQHAEMLGLLNRFARPQLLEFRRAFFFFTYRAEKNNKERGFSSLEDRTHGGKFSALAESIRITEKMDIRTYKSLLHTFLASSGHIDSLKMLDDICHALIVLDAKNPEAQTYEFEWDLRGNGSLTIHLGSMEDYFNPHRVQATIDSLANTIFFPDPALDASLTVGPIDN